jgi:hypothetical protein
LFVGCASPTKPTNFVSDDPNLKNVGDLIASPPKPTSLVISDPEPKNVDNLITSPPKPTKLVINDSKAKTPDDLIAPPPKPTKFVINDPKLKTVDDLIAAMKVAAGSSLPSTATAKDYYKPIAAAFVQNMHAMADAGAKIPREWIAKLKKRNVVVPIMVVVVLWGITFLVPLSFFADLVLASLAVIGAFILVAIVASNGSGKKAKV